ncbi:MAG TPA: hypothetical protein VLD38_08180 [Nitrosopumilaceae archaeon]|nr:hypothetical protein [Nitrosopumilaceae archaeon]
MALSLDFLAKTLLDAPVGRVEQTIQEIIKQPVRLDVLEQELISGTTYKRKIAISFGQIPIVHATVRFDSKRIPKLIMTELMQKKEGIGNILRKNNIAVQRKNLGMYVEPNGKKIIREYEIWYDNLIWFDIIEEIRLDFLNSCQNR